LHREDYEPFALTDPARSYTRNLVATDHETYSLILMCWNPGRESAIHDHPSNGCWVRLLEGQVRERRYKLTEDGLACTRDQTLTEGILYIEDAEGYHKIGNPHPDQLAITLHLYSPPFETCRTWLTEGKSEALLTRPGYYSKYGQRVDE
jgi:cysteine dioxygenase